MTSRLPIVIGLTAVVLTAAVVALLVWSPWSSAGSDAKPSAWDTTMRAVCEAADRADDGEVRAARRVFFDGAHDKLHDLADRTATRDRAVAARLLETKERVEAGLEHPDETLAPQLRDLAAWTRRATTTLNDPTTTSCADGGRTP